MEFYGRPWMANGTYRDLSANLFGGLLSAAILFDGEAGISGQAP